MRKDVLIKRVKEEAKKLRKLATKEELNRLDFDYLDPENNRYCVYGQMTGDCMNERADKLITSSCERVYARESYFVIFGDNRLNGKPKFGERQCNPSHITYLSPIEV